MSCLQGGIATSTLDLSTPVWSFHSGGERSKVEICGVEIAIIVLEYIWGARDIGGKVICISKLISDKCNQIL